MSRTVALKALGLVVLAVLAMLALHTTLAVWSLVQENPTIDEVIDVFGRAIATVLNILDPDAVVIGRWTRTRTCRGWCRRAGRPRSSRWPIRRW